MQIGGGGLNRGTTLVFQAYCSRIMTPEIGTKLTIPHLSQMTIHLYICCVLLTVMYEYNNNYGVAPIGDINRYTRYLKPVQIK